MRLILNGIPVLKPWSGVGHYVHSLGEAVRRLAPEDDLSFFYNGTWSSHLRERPSTAYEMAWQVGRRFGGLYASYRLYLESMFSLANRFGHFDLYHETCFIPYRFDGPTLVTVMDLSFRHYPQTHPSERIRFFEKHFCSRLDWASHFFCPSEFIRGEMVKTLGVTPEKITVTPLGFDPRFHPRPLNSVAGVLSSYGLTVGTYILSVGNLEPRKNLTLLLRAYAELGAKLREKYPLVLAGGWGWLMDDFSSLLSKLGLSQEVRLLGYVPQSDLPALYNGATCFVYPSLYEGFGLPPLEAMASGCPAIVSNTSSLPEVVGEAGLSVDPQDEKGLAKHMTTLLEDEPLRNRLRVSGLAQASQFTWERCAALTHEQYRKFYLAKGQTGARASSNGFQDRSISSVPATCPGCGKLERAFPVITRSEGYSILMCSDCGLEFSDPMKGGDAQWYNQAYVIRHAAIDSRVREYYRWAARHLPRVGSLLDVGCGEGVFVHWAQKKGFEAEGVDFSQEATELGRQWYRLKELHTGTLKDMRDLRGPGHYASATLFEVLEHVESPSSFINEVKSVLRPGGWVALSVPYREAWPVRDENDCPPNHLTRWTPQALRRLFEQGGFEVKLVEQTSRFESCSMFWGYIIRRTVYRLLGVRFSASQPRSRSFTRWLQKPAVRRTLSFFRPRHVRSALVFPLAAVTYLFLRSKFQGTNLMLLARKRA